jgi:putative transposase
VHRRDASRSNAVWQVDHAQLEILLQREDATPGRHWMRGIGSGT